MSESSTPLADPYEAGPSLTPVEAPATGGLPPLTLAQKLLYGMGEGGEAVKNAALQTFLLFYYVQVLGMSASLCGLALMLGLVLDGAVDPLVGTWSDHVRSPLGRRHPFLYAAPLPLALALLALFSPPAGWPDLAKFGWLVSFSLIARAAMSFYYVPHMALGAELSEDFHERLALGSYRMLFTQLGGIACLSAAFTLFFVPDREHANGQLNPHAYQPFALFCGVLVLVFVLGSALGTQKRAREVTALRSRAWTTTPLTLRTFLRGFRQALGVANFRRCFSALLIMYLFAGTQGVLALHMNTYFWGFTPQQAQFVFYSQIGGFLCGLPFSRLLANRWDKKGAYFFCVIGSCSLVTLPIGLRLAGVFPPNGDPWVLVAVSAANILYGFLGATSVVCATAMLADTTDEYELRYGSRAEGMFFGAVSFSSKASIGVGSALAGIILDAIAFPRPPVVAPPTPYTIFQLGFVYGPTLLFALLLGLSLMLRYDLDRRKHAGVLAELQKRRISAAKAV